MSSKQSSRERYGILWRMEGGGGAEELGKQQLKGL